MPEPVSAALLFVAGVVIGWLVRGRIARNVARLESAARKLQLKRIHEGRCPRCRGRLMREKRTGLVVPESVRAQLQDRDSTWTCRQCKWHADPRTTYALDLLKREKKRA